MSEPEQLYRGDIRLDSLYNAIMDEIDNRARGQDITVMNIIGILELIKFRLLAEMDDD